MEVDPAKEVAAMAQRFAKWLSHAPSGREAGFRSGHGFAEDPTHEYFEVWKLGTIAHDLAVHLLSKHHDWPYLDSASLGTGITLRRLHWPYRRPPALHQNTLVKEIYAKLSTFRWTGSVYSWDKKRTGVHWRAWIPSNSSRDG